MFAKRQIKVMSAIALVVIALGATGIQTMAGPTRGSRFWVGPVAAYSSLFFDEWFVGGQTARIVVRGDGDTDLDLEVYDQNGYLITSDTDMSDYCVVQFTPIWTGPFRIVVRNHGSVWNNFRIDMN